MASLGFPDGSAGKGTTCNAGDTGDVGLIPGLKRSSGEGNGNPLQYSCQKNPMDRGAWWAIVHGVTKESDTTSWLNNSHHLETGLYLICFVLREPMLASSNFFFPFETSWKIWMANDLRIFMVISIKFTRLHKLEPIFFYENPGFYHL